MCRGRERVEHGVARDSISCEGEVVIRGLRATSMCFSACFFRLSWVTLLPISAGEQDMEPLVCACVRARARVNALLLGSRASLRIGGWHVCAYVGTIVVHELQTSCIRSRQLE